MSYDLYAVHAAPGASASEIARTALDEVEAALPESEPTVATETRKRTVVDALRAANPMLEPFLFDYSDIARTQGITEAQARTQFRHVELNTPEDGNGIQITVADAHVSITLPYWHRGKAAESAIDEVAQYAAILQQVGDYVIYDPQLDRPLNPKRDRAEMLASYASTLDAVQLSIAGQQKRPWWKFW
jgi:hypothetical protein